MKTKFSEDIVPLGKLKVNPGKVVSHANETHRPILLTSRGRGVAMVQALRDYEEEAGARTFMRGVVKGLMDLEEGREISFAKFKEGPAFETTLSFLISSSNLPISRSFPYLKFGIYIDKDMRVF